MCENFNYLFELFSIKKNSKHAHKFMLNQTKDLRHMRELNIQLPKIAINQSNKTELQSINNYQMPNTQASIDENEATNYTTFS